MTRPDELFAGFADREDVWAAIVLEYQSMGTEILENPSFLNFESLSANMSNPIYLLIELSTGNGVNRARFLIEAGLVLCGSNVLTPQNHPRGFRQGRKIG